MFSDVSHLLTHIASKGHLSHYFKVQVRSRSDAAAQRKLHEYDSWYARHDIEKLLSQRMIQKDIKREGSQTPTVAPQSRAKSSRKRPQSLLGHPLAATRSDFRIDPHLPSLENPLPTPAALPSTPRVRRAVSARCSSTVACSPMWENTAKQMDSQVAASYRRPYLMHLPPTGNENRVAHDGMEMEEGASRYGHAHGNISEVADTSSSAGVSSTSSNTCTLNGEMDEVESNADSSRLKGIIWPGMDLFDSAGADARRKRNQKKESTVLEAMQAQSERIEPTEIIYFPSWDKKKERFISGEVESSPPSSVSPKKRQRARPARQPLMELDVNRPSMRLRSNARLEASKAPASRGRPSVSLPGYKTSSDRQNSTVERTLNFATLNKRSASGQNGVLGVCNAVENSPSSRDCLSGMLWARNPLQASFPVNELDLGAGSCSADARGPSSMPHGLPLRSDINRRSMFFQDHSATADPRTSALDVEQAGAEPFGYHMQPPFQQIENATLPTFYFGVPEVNPQPEALRLNDYSQAPNLLAHNHSHGAATSTEATAMDIHSPWNCHATAPLVVRDSSNGRHGVNCPSKDESSGDETIDQGIDDCIDFFEA